MSRLKACFSTIKELGWDSILYCGRGKLRIKLHHMANCNLLCRYHFQVYDVVFGLTVHSTCTCLVEEAVTIGYLNHCKPTRFPAIFSHIINSEMGFEPKTLVMSILERVPNAFTNRANIFSLLN